MVTTRVHAIPMEIPVKSDSHYSHIDSYEWLNVYGNEGEPSRMKILLSVWGVKTCNLDSRHIIAYWYYYTVKSITGNTFMLLVDDVEVYVTSGKYYKYNCRGGKSGEYVSVSSMYCYVDGVDFLSTARNSIGTTIVVEMTFTSTYATFGQYRVPLTSGSGCGYKTETNWKLILFLSLDAIVCIALLILFIRCAIKRNKKEIPKK